MCNKIINSIGNYIHIYIVPSNCIHKQLKQLSTLSDEKKKKITWGMVVLTCSGWDSGRVGSGVWTRGVCVRMGG